MSLTPHESLRRIAARRERQVRTIASNSRFKNTGLKNATQFRSLGALSLCDVAGTAWTRIADCKPHTQTSKHLRRRVLTSGAGAGNTSSKVSYRTRYTQMFPVWLDALCRNER